MGNDPINGLHLLDQGQMAQHRGSSSKGGRVQSPQSLRMGLGQEDKKPHLHPQVTAGGSQGNKMWLKLRTEGKGEQQCHTEWDPVPLQAAKSELQHEL